MRRPRKSINQINVVPIHRRDAGAADHLHGDAPLINPGTIDLPSVTSQLPTRSIPPLEITVRPDRTIWLRDLATTRAGRAGFRQTRSWRASRRAWRRTRTRRRHRRRQVGALTRT
jgi:hypothetical protein